MFNFHEDLYQRAAGHKQPEQGQYWARVSTTGHLIVKRYLGESDRQEARRNTKIDLGVFQAKDQADARRIAHELRGAK